ERFDAGPTVCLDKEGFKRVVTAILDNAIRFSPSDGSIMVCISGGKGDVWLSVTDQGEGIDPYYLPYVFEELSDPDVAHHSEGHG
ncbi:unnamed protein product, partial [marine sediment metagenome]